MFTPRRSWSSSNNVHFLVRRDDISFVYNITKVCAADFRGCQLPEPGRHRLVNFAKRHDSSHHSKDRTDDLMTLFADFACALHCTHHLIH